MAYGLTADEEKELILSVGTHRSGRRLSPVEVARLFDRMKSSGASFQDCADLVQFEGTTMISRFLQLLKLDSDLQHLVDWGQSGSTVAFTAGVELSKLDRNEQRAAVRAILETGLKSQEVKQLVQLRRRSQKPLDTCVEEIVRLRPHVERRHVIVGLITDPQTVEALGALPQGERDEKLQQALQTTFKLRGGFSCRLGTNRFTITADEPTGDLILKDEDFESSVNAALREITSSG
jgi:hypothetical protein